MTTVLFCPNIHSEKMWGDADFTWEVEPADVTEVRSTRLSRGLYGDFAYTINGTEIHQGDRSFSVSLDRFQVEEMLGQPPLFPLSELGCCERLNPFRVYDEAATFSHLPRPNVRQAFLDVFSKEVQ